MLGENPSEWRDHVVIQNHLSQTVEMAGLRAEAHGRMVRTEQYKYCVYSKGIQRESLVAMQNDPLEMKNLAADPAYRTALLEHRELLRAFGEKHKDALVDDLLADDVGPIPFTPKKAK